MYTKSKLGDSISLQPNQKENQFKKLGIRMYLLEDMHIRLSQL